MRPGSIEVRSRKRPGAAAFAAILLLAGATVSAAKQAAPRDHPGFVDGSFLVDAAGKDAVAVEVNVSGILLKVACRVDAQLCPLVEGVELMQAVILEPESRADRELLLRRVREMETGMLAAGWERLAYVREKDEEVRVLLRFDGERIDGLTVLVFDASELVFANIVGFVDLEALSALGEEFDFPGLEYMGDVDLERRRPTRDEEDEE